MANKYHYSAKTQQGKIIEGEITAESEQQASQVLWKNKLAVVSISQSKKNLMQISVFSRITIRDKAVFARQLATMLKAGFPLLQAISVLIMQTQNEKFKETLTIIVKDLEDGHPLSMALAKHPKLFGTVYINLIKSGESTGKLPKVMEEIATDIEKQAALSGKIRAAMYYPVFVFVALIGIAGLMMVKVIPQLKQIFEESGAQLPWQTRAVIWTSDFLVKFWWLVLIIIAAISVAVYFYAKTKGGRRLFDRLKINIPIFKEVTKNIYMERFARTFSLLSFAGVPILESIKISSKVIGNVIYEEKLSQASAEVERGVTLSSPLSKDTKLFPPMLTQMIGVGEKTGKLETVLNSVAEYYQEEIDRQVKALASLIEPIMIIIIGMGVAVMVFAVIVPIYQIAQIQT